MVAKPKGTHATFATNLAAAVLAHPQGPRNRREITTWLSDRYGVKYEAARKWVGGINLPQIETLAQMAIDFDTTIDALLRHSGQGIPDRDVARIALRRRVPILTSEQVLRSDRGGSATLGMEGLATVNVDSEVGPRAFGWTVEGDAMESLSGGRSYPDGSVVVVDPDVQPAHRTRVLVSLDGVSPPVVRELVVEAGRERFKPLNTRYAIEDRTESSKVYGVVRRTIISE